MAIGRALRRALGPRLARRAGRWYRALFVDLPAVARILGEAIPPRAHVLDVGGGDGEPLNLLLDLRPDIRVTTIDLAAEVGQWLEPRHAARVERRPATDLRAYLRSGSPRVDAVLLCDVMHHVPVAERDAFALALLELLRANPGAVLIVKDVEPGHFRASLGWWADRNITGDKSVAPMSRSDLTALMRRHDARIDVAETAVYATDPPNYALVFR